MTEASDKLCIIIDATRAGAFEAFQFEAITRACADLAEVWLVTNKSPELIGPRHLDIPDAEIFAPANNAKGAKAVIPGNPDLKLLALLARPEMAAHDRFLRMEFDCVFSHDIAKTVAQLDELSRDHDLGYSSAFSQHRAPDWCWWNTVENGREPGRAFPGPLHAAFLPVLMFNRAFMHAYAKALREGWRGHYEALIPSVAQWCGMRVLDFGRSLDFPIAKPVFTIHRPEVFDLEPSRFFHPVKDFDAFKMLPSRIMANYAPHAPDVITTAMGLVARLPIPGRELDLIRRVLRDADRMICYGAPGVVELAVAHGVQQIWHVTSDRADALAAADYPQLATARALGNLQITFVNLGRTGSYGTPLQPFEAGKLARYLWLPADLTSHRAPDTVVVAGRFRVAVAANLYLRYGADPAMRLIVTNTATRPHYAPILDLFETVEAQGGTVLTRALPGREDQAAAILDAHRDDPR